MSFENYPSHSTHVSIAMCSLDKHLKEYSKIKINTYKTQMRYNTYVFYITYLFVSHKRYNTYAFFIAYAFCKI